MEAIEPRPTTTLVAAETIAIDGQGKERKVIAVIDNETIGDPIQILESANAWWMKPASPGPDGKMRLSGLQKVHALIQCFAASMTVEESCSMVGISVRTFYYFAEIHPQFLQGKEALSKLMEASAKATVAKAVQTDPHLALSVLKGTQPERYARRLMPELPGNPNGGYSRTTEELFTDKEGRVVVKRQTAELMQRYGEADK